MATVKEMKATVRPKGGKGAARAVRRAGRVPGVIYGDNKPPLHRRSIDQPSCASASMPGRFLTTLYDVEVDGKKHRVIPRDFQLDPVQGQSDPRRFHARRRRRDDPRQRAGPRHQRRPVARRQARRRGQHRHPHH